MELMTPPKTLERPISTRIHQPAAARALLIDESLPLLPAKTHDLPNIPSSGKSLLRPHPTKRGANLATLPSSFSNKKRMVALPTLFESPVSQRAARALPPCSPQRELATVHRQTSSPIRVKPKADHLMLAIRLASLPGVA
jgi:hypothetical protein